MQKADGNVDYNALEEQFGPEGAEHMAYIINIKRARAERLGSFVMPPRRHPPKPKVPKQDLEDVLTLPASDYEDA
eukprot:365679-Chlamydomonas_euryale.AAC.18